MNKIIQQLKESSEDFEFYPTTNEIIKVLFRDIQRNSYHRAHYSILDIGAGNGKVLNRLAELGEQKHIDDPDKRERLSFTKYAIEKSRILVKQMDSSIFVIGSDFYEQTLIDKQVDIIFCNPPYSDFKGWAKKIILESNVKLLYLVIPERWSSDKELKEAIKKRDAVYKTVGSFDFLNSEDRKARAKVNLVKIDYEKHGRRATDPFDIWFESTFKFQAERDTLSEYEWERAKREELQSLIPKEDIAKQLVKFYNKDLDTLVKNYKKIESLDYEIFKELDINLDSIKQSLQVRIKGLKNLYWKELFDNLDKITDRLTEKSRGKLLAKLMDNTSIDFSENNIYAVVLWVIKNANEYFDSQLLEFYYDISDKENIIKYKSNKRILEDTWRYTRQEYTHYALDYRIITRCYSFLESSWSGSQVYIKGAGINFVKDILTIARNLNIETNMFRHENYIWDYGKQYTFNYKNSTKIFMQLRAYKNNNVHIKFSQEFIKKLNIEAARLNGWIKSPKEASEEFDVTPAEAAAYFKQSFKLLPEQNNMIKLLEQKD